MFARTTFLPTLAYNLLRNRWTSWNWYDRIDETVVLGALPFIGPVTQKLISEENICGVISMNEDFELQFAVSNRTHWQRMGISFLQLNTPDILHSPAQDKLEKGVEFIISHQRKLACNEQTGTTARRSDILAVSSALNEWQFPWRIQNNGIFLDQKSCNNNNNGSTRRPSIYVHCKAGRTRSATLVACYLIKRYGLSPDESVRFITKRRPQVFLHTKQWQAIEEYYKRHGTLQRTDSQEALLKESNFDLK